MVARTAVFLTLLVVSNAGLSVDQRQQSDNENAANPIRRVVKMLQGVEKKI